ncbi:hypothetical protein [Haloparvum sp. PAK95]|uniref:hypothetical protein n=1 Tax=Haloparvum sp. PAK95 TaxID=3418962 RepID=UPI003D2EA3D1
MSKATFEFIDDVGWRHLFVNRWVGGIFLLLLGGFAYSIAVLHNPYVWPFLELGRQTSMLFGCTTLACAPLAAGIGILYTYLFAVLVNALRIAVISD